MRFFISATTADLGDLRDELAKYLRKMGLEVEVQEEFPTDYHTVHQLLVGKIRSCHAVICLIGEVYGFSPPDQDFSPPRSFTQMEYFIARELDLPVYLFFPTDQCRVGGKGTDSDEERTLQQRYIKQIRESDNIWYEFSDRSELNEQVAVAIPGLAELVRLSDSEHSLRQQMPTPLVRLFEENLSREGDDPVFAAGEILRFVALLSTHDAMLHGLLGAERAERLDETKLLSGLMGAREWLQLIELSTPESSQRFVTEMALWTVRQRQCLKRLFRTLESMASALFARRVPSSAAFKKELREVIHDLLESLDFLKRYLFFVVRDRCEPTHVIDIEVLCGDRPKRLVLEMDPDTDLPDCGSVYLLSLDQRTAMPLCPAFWYRSTATQNDLCGLLHCQLDVGAETGQLTIAPFHGQSDLMLSAVPDAAEKVGDDCFRFGRIPQGWLVSGFWSTPQFCRVDKKPLVQQFFSEDAWGTLHRMNSIGATGDRVLANRFRIFGEAIHWGKNAHLYNAVSENDSPETKPPTQHAVHLLREELLQQKPVRDWFSSRAQLWGKLQHPRVLPLDPRSEADPASPAPFLATRFIPDRRTLASDRANGRTFPDSQIIRILRLAAEVCGVAHEQGLRVVSLPLRHFLVAADSTIWLTGFDTLVSADGKHWSSHSTPIDYFRSTSRDLGIMAPELSKPCDYLPECVDLYAIGVLISQLRGIELRSAETLPKTQWNDWLECLRFHCMAPSVSMRIQTIRQFLRVLDAGPDCFSPQGYEATAVESRSDVGKCPGLVGKYPVTNALYQQYCADGQGRKTPIHLGLHEFAESKYWRFAGPWFPVVFVHLDDANGFARWLSHQTGRSWRLPTVSEWETVASRGDQREFPWGHQTPDASRANFENFHRGPTVVGAFDNDSCDDGCFDLAGNVWEWTSDRVFDSAPKRVMKGGAFDYSADALRIQSKKLGVVHTRDSHVGFRLISDGQN